jgi:hypothetical protein
LATASWPRSVCARPRPPFSMPDLPVPAAAKLKITPLAGTRGGLDAEKCWRGCPVTLREEDGPKQRAPRASRLYKSYRESTGEVFTRQVRSPLPHGTENHLEGIALAPLQRLLPCLLSTSSPRLVRHRHRLPQTSRNARWSRQVYRRLKNRARVLTCDHPASLAERLPRFVRVGAGGQGSASRSPITF